MRLMSLLLFAVAGTASAQTSDDFAWQWPIAATGDDGAHALVLDDAVYARITRADLRDLAVFNADGQPVPFAPLPWLPLVNPLELALVLGLVFAAAALRARGPASPGWTAWAFAALLTLTMAVLRAGHQLAGLPWSEAILSERLAQASLTIAWCVAGVVAWILGSRRRNRALWWFGAGLLGIVLLKLVAVDRQYIGNLTGIGSFFAVGLLLIVVGRIAPTPPRPE